jgi:hypothetical protein
MLFAMSTYFITEFLTNSSYSWINSGTSSTGAGGAGAGAARVVVEADGPVAGVEGTGTAGVEVWVVSAMSSSLEVAASSLCKASALGLW